MKYYFKTIDDHNKVVYDSRSDDIVFENKQEANKASFEFHTRHCSANPGWWFLTSVIEDSA